MDCALNPMAGEPGLTKVRDLGTGSFGSVMMYRRVLHDDTPWEEEVAIKFIQRNSTVDYKLVQREVRSHALLNHPHVILFKRLGTTQDRRYVYMMMEYADQGDMFKYIQRKGRLSENDARWFFQQIIIGLDYCHRRGVVNRDLKLENLLLSRSITDVPLAPGEVDDPRNLHCKIADFGLCKKSITSTPKSRVGTLYYMAPEVLCASADKPYDERADIWSVGVILYVLLFKSYPFGVISERDNKQQRDAVLRRIALADWRLPQGVSISPECHDLLRRILVADPRARATLGDIMHHPWFMVELPEGAQYFNEQLVAEQLAEPPRCEQSMEEIDAILRQAEDAPFGMQAGGGGTAHRTNGAGGGGEVGDSTIDSQIDAVLHDEHPSLFDDDQPM